MNPFEDKKEWRKFLATTEDLGTQSSVRLTGVGGGRITTNRSVLLKFDLGGIIVKCPFLVLAEREPTLPSLLMGMDSIMGRFGGCSIKFVDDVSNRTRVRFESNDKVAFDSCTE